MCIRDRICVHKIITQGFGKKYSDRTLSRTWHPDQYVVIIFCLLYTSYLEVTPQQFFDSELHNLPLIDKATDLMKQLDDEDMLADVYKRQVYACICCNQSSVNIGFN